MDKLWYIIFSDGVFVQEDSADSNKEETSEKATIDLPVAPQTTTVPDTHLSNETVKDEENAKVEITLTKDDTEADNAVSKETTEVPATATNSKTTNSALFPPSGSTNTGGRHKKKSYDMPPPPPPPELLNGDIQNEEVTFIAIK